MKSLTAAIHAALPRYRFSFDSEDRFQLQLEEFLRRENFLFEREVRLTARERADFVIDWEGQRVVAEAKVGGGIDGHLRQMKRYADIPGVHGVILFATRPYDMPETLSGKPVGLVNFGGSRL
jgi:hypothetical protein